MTAAAKLIRPSMPTDVRLESAARRAWQTLTGETVESSGSVVPTRRMLRASVALGSVRISAVLPDAVAGRVATQLLGVRAALPDMHAMTLDFVGELVNLIAGILGDELAQRGIEAPLGVPTASLFSGKVQVDDVRLLLRFHSPTYGPFWVALED